MFDGGFLAGTQVWNTTVAFEHLSSADVKVEVLLAVFTLSLGLISPSGWASKIPGDAPWTKQASNIFFCNQVSGEYRVNTCYVPHNNRQGSLTF